MNCRYRSGVGPGSTGRAVIEDIGNRVSLEDGYRLAAVDALRLLDRIMAATDTGADEESRHGCALALGTALLAVVQEYLERTSNDHDVELFLEVNGRQPEEMVAWSVNILAGLRLRRIPTVEYRSICDSAVEVAARRLHSSS